MSENKKSMPERFYALDNDMSLDKIIQAQNSGEPLIGKVVLWNSRTKCLEVDLGNDYSGCIPAEFVSIYPVFNSTGDVAASVRSTIGKNVIVTVLRVAYEDEKLNIILSRKETMYESFNSISNSIGKQIRCCVTNISSFGIFVDVGNGISGLIHYTNLCISRVDKFSDIGIKIGDEITATVVAVDENFHVTLNYKDQFENLAFSLNPGDLIEATILEPLNKKGYFAYLNPNTAAVIDVPEHLSFNYGDKVVAIVKGTRTNHPDQLKLSFVSFA